MNNSPTKINKRIVQDPITGFDIGVDHARYGISGAYIDSADGQFRCVSDGFRHGKLQFPKPTVRFLDEDARFIRKWLHLRLNAFRRGRQFSPELTWEYLKNIDTKICPIVRTAFTYGRKLDTDWTIDRINNDAAYAPGNVACMSARANEAKNRKGTKACLISATAAQQSEDGLSDGLDESQWMRLTYLTSINSTKDSSDYGMLPMVLYPPPGVLLMNSYHVLQYLFIALFFPVSKSNCRANALLRAFKALDDHNLYKCILKFASLALATHLRCLSREPNREFAIGDAWATPLMTLKWVELVEKMSCDQVLWAIANYHNFIKSDRLTSVVNSHEYDSWSLGTRGFVTHEDRFSHHQGNH